MRRLVLAFLMFAAAMPAPAGGSPLIAAGERVRLELGGNDHPPASTSLRFEAIMNRMNTDSLWVMPRGGRATRGFAIGEVTHLDRYAGRDHPAGMTRGLLIGLGAGVAGGLVIGMLLGTADNASFGDGFALAIPLGAIAGAATGAVVGKDRWERVW